MSYKRITALTAAALLILSACGQRGALYNPKTAPEKTSTVETDATPPLNSSASTSEGS